MILDSSAIIAILKREPERERFLRLIDAVDQVGVSVASVMEASMVLGLPRQPILDEFLSDVGAELVAIDRPQLSIAREAHNRFGRGSGSRAKLNFGDCFSYALAMATGRPLLFKGNDFVHTDVLVAAPPAA